MMQASVVDMQRDKSYQLATDSDVIVVENTTQAPTSNDLTLNNIDLELNYF